MTTTQSQTITLIDRTTGSGPVQFGKRTLIQALTRHGIAVSTFPQPHPQPHSQPTTHPSLILGLISDPLIQGILRTADVAYPDTPETTITRHLTTAHTSAVLLSGTDDRGLMYTLLDVADRVLDAGPACLTRIPDQVESPALRIRGLDRFVMGPLDDEWFLSEEFWRYYLARLARCRFNRFVLITGFDTAYMSPPYPFFIEVPGYPDVAVDRLTPERRDRNLAQLDAIGRLCHQHGLEFVFGTWQQTPWTKAQQQLVRHLPEDETALAQYCAAGLRALISRCPSLDGIHFRVNLEAGIGDRHTNEAFWHTCIAAVAEANPDIELDLRAKGLTDNMIAFAQQTGLRVSVPTKYWCEHAGLPHHLTQMRTEELTQLDDLNHARRYSYADLLRKPRGVDLIYRLWNQGSNTLFTSGDPDYARRFVHSCHLGRSAGFEIAAPLTMKGGHVLAHKDPWHPFKAPELRTGRWEDERYWPWYLIFGRLGYSPATDREVWEREYRARFGPAAPHVERAYSAAGKILPLITAAHMPQHPMLHYWTEMSTGAALFAEHNADPFRDVTYATAEPSDPGLFYGIAEYARDAAQNALQRKYPPLQVGAWLRHLARQIDAALLAAEGIIQLGGNPEFQALKVDFLMLRDLAEYHAAKIRAVLSLSRHELSGDPDPLRAAHAFALTARARWLDLAERGAAAYHPDLECGAGNGTARRGNWQNRSIELERDIERLEEMLRRAGVTPSDEPADLPAPEGFAHPAFACDLPATCVPGQDLHIRLTAGGLGSFHQPLIHYRHANQLEGPFRQASMEPSGDGYAGSIPGDYLTCEWDLLVYFSDWAPGCNPVLLPGIFHPEHLLPYFVVEVVG